MFRNKLHSKFRNKLHSKFPNKLTCEPCYKAKYSPRQLVNLSTK